LRRLARVILTMVVHKTRLLLTLILTTSILLAPSPVRSQASKESVLAVWEVSAQDEDGWTVGDLIPLQLRVLHPSDVSVTLPELPTSWGPFEVSEQSLAEPVQGDDGTVTSVLAVSAILWAPGEHETPPAAVRIRDSEGAAEEVLAKPIVITVRSVLTKDDLEKRDLKPQASLPRPPIWPWAVAGIAAAALLALGIRKLVRWHRSRSGTGDMARLPVDDRFPEEIAYEELSRIEALDLPAQRQFKRHYTLVTDCVRVYIEGIYEVPAMDRTTREVLLDVRGAGLDGTGTRLLRALLEEADLVKFAKLVPSIEGARLAVGRVRRFVDITRPSREEADASSPGQDSGSRE
jgi:hypothetical protein